MSLNVAHMSQRPHIVLSMWSSLIGTNITCVIHRLKEACCFLKVSLPWNSVAHISVCMTGRYTTKITKWKAPCCLRQSEVISTEKIAFFLIELSTVFAIQTDKLKGEPPLAFFLLLFLYHHFLSLPPPPFIPSSLCGCGLLFYPPHVLRGTNWHIEMSLNTIPLTVAFMCLC